MTESTRHQWVCTAHDLPAIHDTLTKFNNVSNTSSDHHVDVTFARVSRDTADCQKLYDWLIEHSPFITGEQPLMSLSTGVTDTGEMTCHNAEIIGLEIQLKLDEVPLSGAKIKQKDSVRGFNDKLSTYSVNNKSVAINPTLLFTQLAALAGREENVQKYFKYELTTYPMSLFKDGVMRKPDKAALRNLILTAEVEAFDGQAKVVDGGALLHQIVWPTGITYGKLLAHHISSIRNRYGTCHVVFDGYDIPSVKDHEHLRRSTRVSSKQISFTNEMRVLTKREDFLSNNKNKSLLISKLKPLLEKDNQNVTLSKTDAYTDIVRVALETKHQK